MSLSDSRDPFDVIRHPQLEPEVKRAILASWASDAHAVEDQPALRHPPDVTADPVRRCNGRAARPRRGARSMPDRFFNYLKQERMRLDQELELAMAKGVSIQEIAAINLLRKIVDDQLARWSGDLMADQLAA